MQDKHHRQTARKFRRARLMPRLTTLLMITAMLVPIWKIHLLNASVDHLRDGQTTVPFFAYYRYGFQTDSVVFNVNARSCDTVVDHVIPVFRDFVTVMHTVNPSEVRLAWQGETVAIIQRSAMESIWQGNKWRADFTLDPLSQAIVCQDDGALLIDWNRLAHDPSVLI